MVGRLAALKTTATPDLKQMWRELFAAEPPPYNRRFLESRLSYRIGHGRADADGLPPIEVCIIHRRAGIPALGAWRAARASAPDMTEDEARLALERLDPLWEELFPAEQARIIRLLVDRVDIGPGGADVRLKLEGLASLVRDLAAPAEAARAAA